MNRNSVKNMISDKHKCSCPYCSSQFNGTKILSKHIDDLHVGKGLLEGNIKNW